VGNLDPSTQATDLQTIFERFGAIKEVHVLKDREGHSKRSGFVKMFSKRAADLVRCPFEARTHTQFLAQCTASGAASARRLTARRHTGD
jgi:hypothetical protein